MQKYKTQTQHQKQNKKALEKERVHTNRTYVGQNQNTIDKNLFIARSRIEQYQLREKGKTVFTQDEKIHYKKTKKTSAHCFCGMKTNAQKTGIIKTPEGKYTYKNVSSCKYIWRCPFCAQKILSARGKEIYKIAHLHQHQGLQMGMCTFTVQHSKTDSLEKTMNKILIFYRKFQQHTFFKNLNKNNIIGQIRAFEITNTKQNGWHPHFHIIYFFNSKLESEVNEIQKDILQKWVNYTKGSLKGQDQSPIYSLGEISEYVTKWDAIQETTNTHSKSSKGIAPFQLLRILKDKELLHDFTNQEQSDKKTLALWLEYIEATKGKRRIIISKRLTDLYNQDTKTDEEILEQKEEGEFKYIFSDHLFNLIYQQKQQAYLINICEEFDLNTTKQKQEIIEHLQQFDHITHFEKNGELIIYLTSELN